MGNVQPMGEVSYPAAESDLEWFFMVGDAAMGLHGHAYASGGGGGVFDEWASHQAHLALRTFRHREDVARHARIAPRVAALPVQHRLVAAAAYSPHAWDPNLRQALRGRRARACLVGVAFLTRAAVAACAAYMEASHRALRKRAEKARDRSALAILDDLPPVAPALPDIHSFLVFEAGKGTRRKLFYPMLAEAETLLAQALRAYDELRFGSGGRPTTTDALSVAGGSR